MNENTTESVKKIVEDTYSAESRRVFATLVRVIGDFDLAEEALHEAFTAAMERWSIEGVPPNRRAWLVSVGRNKAIDALRRRTRFDASLAKIAKRLDRDTDVSETDIEDDRLRLIFTCCHPALASTTQTALTLREICGLTTEEIARAFLTAPSAIAQRIVRGKAKIRDAGIPYQVPSIADLPERLESVLSVIYLVFNEGYSASSGETLTRADLCVEAIRLGRLLVDLLPDPEAMGLLALMLLQESRHTARTSQTGDLVLLEEQDRSLWNRELIAEGTALVERVFATRQVGAYVIQAAISAVHANSPTPEATDWSQITALYDLLVRAVPSPIVGLNRAIAVAMRDGPEAGISLIDSLLEDGELSDYHLVYAAKADLCRRLGRRVEAVKSYRQALELARQEPERRFLQKRLRELE